MGDARLFLGFRNTAQPAVYQYFNAMPIVLGSPFGSSYTPAIDPEHDSSRNRVIHFLGEVYAVLGDGVYRYNQGPGNFPSGAAPGTWSKSPLDNALTFSDTLVSDFDQQSLSGLYVINIGGVPHIVGVKRHTSSSTAWEAFKFNSATGAWSESGAIATGLAAVSSSTTAGGIHNSFIFNGVLHFSYGNSTNTASHAVFDPTLDIFSQVSSSGSGGFKTTSFQIEYCMYLNRLFAVNSDTTTDANSLWEYVNGTWTHLSTIEPAGAQTAVDPKKARNCFFTDGTNMYLVSLIQSPSATWKCYQIDNTLTITDITASVLPASLLSGRATVERFQVMIDNDTSIGNPTFLLYHSASATPGSQRTAYQWNGNASLLTQVDVGGDVAHAAPTDTRSGGERFFTENQLDVAIIDVSPVFGGEQVTFKVFGDAGGPSDKKFKLYYTLEGEPDVSEATLKLPVTGGSATLNAVLNQVEGITADGTQYTVVWDTVTDSITSGLRVTRYPRTFL